jgi:hypothetical protein
MPVRLVLTVLVAQEPSPLRLKDRKVIHILDSFLCALCLLCVFALNPELVALPVKFVFNRVADCLLRSQ